MIFDDDQCHVCLMKKGEHTMKCYYEMYVESGGIDYAEWFDGKSDQEIKEEIKAQQNNSKVSRK